MIKPTFYNLPDEKKERLFLAARKEFSRVPYTHASINQITKDAGISRGSFYTYFDDKSDLVQYMLSEYFKIVASNISSAMAQSNGDVFKVFVQLFDCTIEYTEFKNDIELFHSMFHQIYSSADSQFRNLFSTERFDTHLKYMIKSINREGLRVSSDNDLEQLLDLLFIVTKKSMAKAMTKDADKAAVRDEFLYQLSIIKYGIQKENEQQLKPLNPK